jgi:hypothetical protein
MADGVAFDGVENVDEIRSEILEAADVLAEIGAIDDPTSLEEFYGNLSDDGIAQIFSERPITYHALDGFPLEVGQPLAFDDQLPNAFGGAPFPAMTTVEITNLVDADGCIEVTMTVVPDPEQFFPILEQSMRESGLVDEANPFDPATLEADIVNTVVGQYDGATGFAKSVYASQLIEMDGERRLDETTIRDVTPE